VLLLIYTGYCDVNLFPSVAAMFLFGNGEKYTKNNAAGVRFPQPKIHSVALQAMTPCILI
jgi:hypothetical protein